MFGELPAWGFYLRHAEGVVFRNVTLRYRADDFRPAVVMDDVRDSRMTGLQIPTAKELPVILLHETRAVTLEGLGLTFPPDRAVRRVNHAVR
jgi:hypothetical protein